MDGFKNRKFKKKNFTDIAYDKIKELILKEEIEPGEILSENQLAEYLDMSRTPVREAIRRLEAEGVLKSQPGHGTILKALTLKDIADIFEVREAMEIIAAQTAIRNIRAEELQALKQDFLKLLERSKKGETVQKTEFTKLDSQIHNLIVESSDNEYVKMLMERIYFNVDRYRCISFNASLDIEESARQHLELIECIEKRDIESLKEQLHRHIQWSMEIIQTHTKLETLY